MPTGKIIVSLFVKLAVCQGIFNHLQHTSSAMILADVVFITLAVNKTKEIRFGFSAFVVFDAFDQLQGCRGVFSSHDPDSCGES